MASSQSGYAKQKRFDQKLEGLGLFDFSGFGPSPAYFFENLEVSGLCLKGWNLTKA